MCTGQVPDVHAQDLNRASGSYFGKVRSNYLGTEFTLYDDGPSPKRSRDGEHDHSFLAALAAFSHMQASKRCVL